MSSFFGNIFKSVSEFLNKFSNKARTRLLILIAAIIIFAIVIVVVLNRTQYSPLITVQSPAEANEIHTILSSMNVPVITEGNTILVPDNRVVELKNMLMFDGFYGAEPNYDLFNQASGFGVTDEHRQKLYEAVCASEIRAQILMVDKITNAFVKVNMGKTSAFAITRDASEPTCSVTFTLKSGATLSNHEAQTIAEIVRTSVQGIKYENMSINDSKLKNYPVGDASIDIGTEIQSRFAMSNLLEQQIQIQGAEMFSPVFGTNNVRVNAHVELNFDRYTEEIIEFSPPNEGELGGIIRSSSELLELQRINGIAEGAPGTQSNGMGATEYPYSDLNNDETYLKRLNEYNYEINQTIKTIEGAMGQVSGLSIAILINSDAVEGDYAKEIRDLAAKSFGCAPANISVQSLPFAEREKTAEEIAAEWEAIENQMRKRKLMETIIIWAVILILGLAFMALVRSIVKNVKEPEESETALAGVGMIDYLVADGGGLTADAEDEYGEADEEYGYDEELEEEEVILNAKSPGLEQIEKFIEKDPASVASLLRNWLAEEE